MKRIVLIMALTSFTLFAEQVFAASFGDFLGAAIKEMTKDTDGQQQLAITQVQSACEGRKLGEAASAAHSSLYSIDPNKTPTVELFCSTLRENTNQDDVACYANCESRYRDEFTQVKVDRERRALAEKEKSDRSIAAQQKEESNAALEKQKAESRDADLRAGRVKPANIEQAMVAYSAENGISLASAPKIRPDGKLYALIGIIENAGSDPEFLAMLGSRDPRYYMVKIPKALRSAYFDKAKIGDGFILVGKYTGNTNYKTIVGQQKSAPVFEAVYFVMQ